MWDEEPQLKSIWVHQREREEKWRDEGCIGQYNFYYI